MDKDIRKPAVVGYTSPLGSVSNIVSPRPTQTQPDQIEIVVDTNVIQNEMENRQDEEDNEEAPLLGGSARPKATVWSELNNWFAKTFTPNAVVNRPTSQQQKRIVLPVRVEPKVFFANERTFLSWLHFCIVLGGLALGLLNFGDRVGQISGLLFTLVAMMFIIYALFLFQWRAHQIRNRHPGPYDDRVGPTVLVTALFFAILTNFYLKFTSGSK
jgi:uncharacterized membrane protein YidH (DUF202 family)